MKIKNYIIIICVLFTSAPIYIIGQGNTSVFRGIYDSQMRYFKDSLDSYSFYKQIVDFGKKSRQKLYEAHHINISTLKTCIILEGNSNAGGVYTGILFEDGKEIAYMHNPDKGWQFSFFKKSEFDSLSSFTGIGLVIINKVSSWDIGYINKQKHTVGGTGVSDGYSFIASRVSNKKNIPIIETIGFAQFNILY